MVTPLELLLGLRYLRARTRNRFVSFISVASTVGIALGVAALITVISVMNGFSGELRDNLLSLTAHVTVRGADGSPLDDWRALRERLAAAPGVAAVSAFVEGEGMVVQGTRLRGVRLEGLDPADPDVRAALGTRVVRGELDALVPGSDAALLGAGLAAVLGIDVGRRVNLLLPRVGAATQVVPTLTRVTLAGVFDTGVQERDNSGIVLHRQDAAALLGLPDDAVDGLRVRLLDLMAAPRLAGEWQRTLGTAVQVTDWSQEQAAYFRAVKLEKVMMFLILSLIVAVAVFNVVATLVMVVNDKRTDIAILRTMGLTPASVTAVFVLQGVLIGLIGTGAGLLGGLALSWNLEALLPRVEALLHVKLIPTDVYYVNHIPVDVRAVEVLWISLSAFLLATLATVYPARRAAATQPADALRYE